MARSKQTESSMYEADGRFDQKGSHHMILLPIYLRVKRTKVGETNKEIRTKESVLGLHSYVM